MSCKVNMTNGVTLKFENQLYTKTPPLDATVKFAGEEAKDRLYEPKHKKKVVRVLTVIAYVFFVSLAAIMLSLYYIFIWHGEQSKPAQQIVRIYSKCDTGVFADVTHSLKYFLRKTVNIVLPYWEDTKKNVTLEITLLVEAKKNRSPYNSTMIFFVSNSAIRNEDYNEITE